MHRMALAAEKGQPWGQPFNITLCGVFDLSTCLGGNSVRAVWVANGAGSVLPPPTLGDDQYFFASRRSVCRTGLAVEV
jgi:hypothetical protein